MNLQLLDRIAQVLLILCLVLGLITTNNAPWLYWGALLFAVIDVALTFMIKYQSNPKHKDKERLL